LSETELKLCSKCGGEMKAGDFTVPMQQMRSPELGEYTPGFMNTGLPPGVETFAAAPVWEERTGEKKGLIFKRPEVKKMRILGYRCSVCNYIELNVKP
jgi:hypothetical protein